MYVDEDRIMATVLDSPLTCVRHSVRRYVVSCLVRAMELKKSSKGVEDNVIEKHVRKIFLKSLVFTKCR